MILIFLLIASSIPANGQELGQEQSEKNAISSERHFVAPITAEDRTTINTTVENEKTRKLWLKRVNLYKKLEARNASLNEDSCIAKIHAEAMIQKYGINDLSERYNPDVSLQSEKTFENNVSEKSLQRELKQERYKHLEELKKKRAIKNHNS